MKKIISTVLAFTACVILASCTPANVPETTEAPEKITTTAPVTKTDVNIAVLKGPTGMGAAYLMEQNEAGKALNNYTFTVASSADSVTAEIIKGTLDIAAVPTNLAAVLDSKDGVDVKVIAVNTLGVLYICEKGESIKTAADLAGKTILTAGEGTAADAVLTKVVLALPEESRPTIVYATEHAEVVTQAVTGKYDVVALPEPFVTMLLSKSAEFKVALNLTSEWENAGCGKLVMGCLIATDKFISKNPEAVKNFITDYSASVEYVNSNNEAAAALIEKYGISTAAVAVKALPNCNIVCMTGEEMKTALSGFYSQLMTFKPGLVGGAMPQDRIYYLG